MGRPKDSHRKEQIIHEYNRQIRTTGMVNYTAITRAVGLKSNTGTYAKRVVQHWLESQRPTGQLRECLCCDRMFLSAGKHDRLCPACGGEGDYTAPYSISPVIMCVGRW